MGVTKIEWTDYTFNHVIGCQKVAAGCEHCYANEHFRTLMASVGKGQAGRELDGREWNGMPK